MFSSVLSQLKIIQSSITRTRKRTTALSAPFEEFNIVPPFVEFAPTFTLALIVRKAEIYSASSSLAPSVLGPTNGPFKKEIVFGIYSVLISSVSVINVFSETSEPIFFPTTVYSKISFGIAGGPLRSLI